MNLGPRRDRAGHPDGSANRRNGLWLTAWRSPTHGRAPWVRRIARARCCGTCSTPPSCPSHPTMLCRPTCHDRRPGERWCSAPATQPPRWRVPSRPAGPRKRHLHLVRHLIAQQYANLGFLLLAQNALLATCGCRSTGTAPAHGPTCSRHDPPKPVPAARGRRLEWSLKGRRDRRRAVRIRTVKRAMSRSPESRSGSAVPMRSHIRRRPRCLPPAPRGGPPNPRISRAPESRSAGP